MPLTPKPAAFLMNKPAPAWKIFIVSTVFIQYHSLYYAISQLREDLAQVLFQLILLFLAYFSLGSQAQRIGAFECKQI